MIFGMKEEKLKKECKTEVISFNKIELTQGGESNV